MPEPIFDDLERELRGLPSPRFRFRLRAELTGEQTVTPYVIAGEIDGMIDFVKQLFHAEELMRAQGSAGGTHAELQIGDSKVMLGGGVPQRGNPAALHVYVSDVDAAHARALSLGAAEVTAPQDQFYGERSSCVADAFGNRWYIAAPLGQAAIPRGLRNVNICLHPAAAGKLIDFLERAVDAETVERHDAPNGAVMHAQLRIGSSSIEIGEAHGPYQPLKTAIFLNVDNADAAYEQAIEAGATSMNPPADQPFGARLATIEDPAGHTWFLVSPLRSS